MFSRFVKFNRDDGYEDLDGNIDMDITDMANMASLGGNVQEGGDGGNKQKEPPEG